MAILDVRDIILPIQVDASSAKSAAADAEVKAQAAMKAAMLSRVELGTFVLTFSGPIALSLAPVTRSIAVPLAKAGDFIAVHRRSAVTNASVSITSGFGLFGSGYVPVDGTVEVTATIPAVTLGAALTCQVALVAYRPTA